MTKDKKRAVFVPLTPLRVGKGDGPVGRSEPRTSVSASSHSSGQERCPVFLLRSDAQLREAASQEHAFWAEDGGQMLLVCFGAWWLPDGTCSRCVTVAREPVQDEAAQPLGTLAQ